MITHYNLPIHKELKELCEIKEFICSSGVKIKCDLNLKNGKIVFDKDGSNWLIDFSMCQILKDDMEIFKLSHHCFFYRNMNEYEFIVHGRYVGSMSGINFYWDGNKLR